MAGKILKSLILVESAAKARTIRKFVGRTYSVMATDGFLKDLPKSRIGVDDTKDYLPDYITVRGKGKLFAELKRETLNARRIFFATNPDSKGEFLARQYCELFGVNPKSHCRIWLDELTRENFHAAFENAQSINDDLANAFQTKQLIDKYVSHKVGEYLSRKIWRGVKVGRFRAMLLKLIAEPIEQKNLSEEQLLMDILDLDVDDWQIEEDMAIIFVTENKLAQAKAEISKKYNVVDADFEYKPTTVVNVTDEESLVKMEKLLDALENNDDVQKVWHNLAEDDGQEGE